MKIRPNLSLTKVKANRAETKALATPLPREIVKNFAGSTTNGVKMVHTVPLLGNAQ